MPKKHKQKNKRNIKKAVKKTAKRNKKALKKVPTSHKATRGKAKKTTKKKVDEVLKRGKMPACVTGQAEVKVEANITLSPKTGKNYSIPPDSNGRPTEQHYYEATLNRLDNVVITYEPCQD